MPYINSKLFTIQMILQFVLLLLFYLFYFGPITQVLLAGILLCSIGIPHGANDHLYRKEQNWLGMLKFLVLYLGIIAAYALLWYFIPLLALLVFFVVSFHHFGQSNFENENISYFPSILWGIVLLAFPVVLHLEEALFIFKAMIGKGNFNEFIYDTSPLTLTNWQIATLLLLGFAYLISIYIYQKQHLLKYCLQLVLVTLWYLFTPLLFGFIVVFCLWHALQSTQHQVIFYTQRYQKRKRDFFIAMLPFSLISLAGFAFYLYFFDFNIGQSFILLSLITLPHVLVMHRLYGG
ncbi:beta-carotene 15,15'-monooxygenase, Brp/Blh family [Pedobacter glucosidilyticus]|nr:Brp/Blh family beta-carotene 15,15'-dioxygenase [Pedobacter glucosidilyticus]KHJ36784.1 beta-carotene 15,15'-monooxygenase, Brp/Blh family [Pedobacter glucosidilyticus]